jgi:hypothetical protein
LPCSLPFKPPRSEVDLRQKLTQRDERVAELKQELAAKNRALLELQRRGADAPRLQRSASGALAGSGGLRRPSASPGALNASAGGTAARPDATGAAAAWGGGDDGDTREPSPLSRAQSGVSAAAAAAAVSERRHLSGQVGQLRVQLAKRDADVQRLEGGYALEDAAVPARGDEREGDRKNGIKGGLHGSSRRRWDVCTAVATSCGDRPLRQAAPLIAQPPVIPVPNRMPAAPTPPPPPKKTPQPSWRRRWRDSLTSP